MLNRLNILTILWLGLLSCQLVYADTCPVDSVITYDQNDNPTAKTIYAYDEAGRTTLTETIKLTDNIITGGTKTETTYYSNGKVKSTATWKWSTATNGWIGNEKNVYTYNDKGSTLTWEIYNWGTDDWTNKNKYEYQYENKKQTLAITYTGDGDKWISKTKQEYSYDAKGNTIFDCYYSGYDVTTSQWIGDHKYIYQYNGSQLILNERYNWKDNDWYGTSKTEYGYNATGKQTLYINYTWNTTTSSFDKSTETYYDYDQWNNIILQEQYKWQGNQRIGQAKVRYEYTAYNSDPIMTATFQWDATQNIFIGVDSIRIAKDAADNLILDEQYTWSGNDWVGTKKEEYIYDANKLVLSTITYKWDVVKNMWGYSTKVLADYDNHKNQTKDERYQWAIDASLPEGGYWKGTKYEVTTYNDKNVETDKITYQWDDTNRRWLGSSKSNYEFDAANHLILEEQYTWVLDPSNPAGGYWQGTKKESFGYNAANQQIKHVTYEWGNTINNWIGKDSVLSNYDSNKNQTLNEQYTWTIDASPEGGYWRGTVKEEYTFNKNKQQTSSLIYTWNDANRNWDYVSKTKTEYDTKKNLILDERYEWQNGAWVGTLKKEYAYNAQGQQTMFAFYAWDEAKKAFVGTQKEETELDAEGRTILHATYTWGTNNWIGKSKTEYIYTTTNQIATEIISKWSNNTWVYSTKTENTYTDNKITSYIQYNWVNNAWVAATKWEQVNANTERTYEWWNNTWSITQEKTKEYDGQNRLVREVNQNYSHGTPTSGSKTEYTYTGDNLTQQSSYTFESDWVETDRITNTFDTENRLTNTTTYTRVGSQLQYVSKTDNEYNGKNITTTSYTWTGTAWQGVEKEEKIYTNDLDYTGTKYEWKNGGWSGVSKTGYTFYSDGKEQAIIVYRWSGTVWVADTKTEYEYSGEKNIVTAMYQWENNSWVGQSRIGNYYDEGEDLTTATWTWTNGAWAPNTKLGESHDADGNLTGQTTYSKKGNDFIYNTKTEYEYGATTKDKTTATYKWNTTTNAWQGVSKSGVTYASNGKIASETTYTWISGLTWQPNQKKEYEYGVQAKDLTTAIYQWDATISAWVGVSKSGVTYASNGKIASEFSYTWNGTDWVGVTKTEYEYGDGKNNSVATYKGNGTEWVGVVKKSEVYTATGDSLGFYTYCWKDGAWVDSLKQEYTYNEYGDKILFIDAKWNGSAWANTVNSTKWEIEYYDYGKGLVSVDAHYTWYSRGSTKYWKGEGYRIENEYDLNSHLIKILIQSPSKNTWVNYSLQEWNYDIVGHEIISINLNGWQNGTWSTGSKIERSYINNMISMSAAYYWSDNMWHGTNKTENIYNDKLEEIGNYTYGWSEELNDWIGLYKYEKKYDSQGNIIEQINSSFNLNTNNWVYDSKYNYSYDIIHGKTGEWTYSWNDNEWALQYQLFKQYDDDQNQKLREDLSSMWIEGKLSTYSAETYYYHCDPKFTITVQTANEGEGEVTGSGIYTYYARPQIVAIDTPNCFTFTQWTDGDTNATRRIIVTEDKTFTAEFTPIKHTITATVNDNISGSVSVMINQ